MNSLASCTRSRLQLWTPFQAQWSLNSESVSNWQRQVLIRLGCDKNHNRIFFIEPDLLEKFLLRVGQESFLRHLARSWEDFCGWFCLVASGDMVVSNTNTDALEWDNWGFDQSRPFFSICIKSWFEEFCDHWKFIWYTLWLTLALSLALSGFLWLSISLTLASLAQSGSFWLSLAHSGSLRRSLGGSKKPKYKNSKSSLQFLVAFCFLITKI